MRRSLEGLTRGFSLVETIIGVSVFMVMAVSVYQAYQGLLAVVSLTRAKTVAAALSNEIFEIAHNLPYADVGVPGGVPSGKLPHAQTLVRDGITFQATTTVRNVDDPFDGVIGGAPNDTAPADYKLVEVEVGCEACRFFEPLLVTGRIAPKNLEIASGGGALFIKVFDASGVPVSGAYVTVSNTSGSVSISDTTNASGVLQLVDIPPGNNDYRITVSKAGYSNDRTYPPGASENPNPTKPDATILSQQVTQISFAIDLLSSLSLKSTRDTCASVQGISGTLYGSKEIGTNPSVLKYSSSFNTGPSGILNLNSMEWDTYSLSLSGSAYNLLGFIPPVPFLLSPGESGALSVVLTPADPKSLLVTVTDAGSLLPLPGVSVTLGSATLASTTLTTGRGFFGQSDWSGGSGQATSTDESKFLDSDGNAEYLSTPGQVTLKKILGQYQPSAVLTSSSLDAGSPTNFYQALIIPSSQPSEAGEGSARLQIATNDDGGAWEYLGPDGTSGTYYSGNLGSINPIHNGDRYLRYRLFLSTASTTWTPTAANVFFTFSSECTPPGQVLFQGLSAGSYNLLVSKGGYQNGEFEVSVSADNESFFVTLQPQ